MSPTNTATSTPSATPTATATSITGPCTITFDNGAGTQLWQTAANWTGDRLPGASDNVCIPAQFTVTLSAALPAANQTINTLDSDGSLIIAASTLSISGAASLGPSLEVKAGTINFNGTTTSPTSSLTIDGGTANFNSSLVVASGVTFTLSAGTLGGSGTVTVSGLLTWSGGAMVGTGRTCIGNMSNAVCTNTGATLQISGTATKTLSARTVDNLGSTKWTGGNILAGSGATFNNGGPSSSTATFEVLSNQSLSHNNVGGLLTFNNYGLVTKTVGGGTTSLGASTNGITFVNQASGTIKALAGILAFNGSVTATGAAANSPTFETGAGATFLFNTLTTASSLDASTSLSGAGNVQFAAANITLAGTYNIGGTTQVSGGTVTFTGDSVTFGSLLPITGGVINLDTPVSAFGPILSIDGGTVNFNVNQTVPAPTDSTTTFSLTSGTLAGSGTVAANSRLSWSGGTMSGSGRTTAAAGVDISGTATKTLSARTVDNLGSTKWTGGNISAGSGATFNNGSPTNGTATFEAQSNQSLSHNNVGGLLTFNNYGLITKTIGGGTTSMGASTNGITFVNRASGTVKALAGTLAFNGSVTATGTAANTPTFETGAGATLLFNTLTTASSLDASTSLSGAGSVQFAAAIITLAGTYNIGGTTQITGGTVNFNSTVSGFGSAVTIDGGTANFNVDMTIPTTVSFTLISGTLGGSGTVTVPGLLTWSGGTMAGTGRTCIGILSGSSCTDASGSALAITGTATKTLSARTIDNRGTTTWTGTGAIAAIGGAIFNNFGVFDAQTDAAFTGTTAFSTFNNHVGATLKKSAGTGLTHLGISTGGLILINDGTLAVQSGTIDMFGPLASAASDGSFDVANGATLIFDSGNPLILGPNSSITGAGTVDFAGATITMNGSYNLSGATVVSSGSVTFASVSTSLGNSLTVSGGTATFNAPANVSSYAQTGGVLKITSALAVDVCVQGKLQVSGAAALGGTLQVTTDASCSFSSGQSLQVMTFATRNGTTFAASPAGWTVVYNPTDVTLLHN